MKRPSKSLGWQIASELRSWSQTSEFEITVKQAQQPIVENLKLEERRSQMTPEQLSRAITWETRPPMR